MHFNILERDEFRQCSFRPKDLIDLFPHGPESVAVTDTREKMLPAAHLHGEYHVRSLGVDMAALLHQLWRRD